MARLLAGIAALLFTTVAAHAQTTIQVLDSGAEPRAPLRYQFKEGRTERSTMDMTMSMSMEMDGQLMPGASIPPIRAIAITRVADVAPDGSARIEFESGTVEMELDQSVPGMDQTQLGRALSGLSQVKGWHRMDSSGRTLESHFPLPDGMFEGASQQMAESLMGDLGGGSETLQQFPLESVGVGARWQVITDLVTGDAGVRTTEEFTLKARTGNRVELDVKTQQLLIPGPASAAAGLVTNGSGQGGSGTMVIDLEGAMPAMTMEIDQGSETIMPGQGGGTARVMKSRMQMRVSVVPAAE